MFDIQAQSQTSTPLLAIMAAIERLQGTISMARALVVAGRSIDLEGLDQEAARLCLAVACLPSNDGQSLLAPLHALAREVDFLAAALPRP